MAKLNRIIYHFLTTGDGIDHNTRIEIKIYEIVGGQERFIARGNFTGGGGEIFHDCEIMSTIDRSQLDGKHSQILIAPVGNDKWQCNCDVKFTFDDNSVASFNHGNIRLGNHDGWGHFVDTTISGITALRKNE